MKLVYHYANATTVVVSPSAPVIVWSMSNPCTNTNFTNYFQVAFNYTARGTTETLTFGVMNALAHTSIDDVSVRDLITSTELLCNGGFENGTTCSPCWTGYCAVNTTYCHNGNYCIYNGASTMTYMSQIYTTSIGRPILISFWIRWTGSGSGVTTIVTVQP
ncbi:unnamed protein product [Didymodactylos carnosus]|uniref:Uncharacterized protein n=1 Tax=Didymodactylos carnosus TaxID=1234261 RepID=A0A814V162_9BILA|nr:unnamed protein product [Didymodactylos carnosus]CAF1179264.1 unnamed protein product [Didymodactylos carnosus]CAF3525706.1 unnamed protein product [Didymodactylos carnosus]CAF3943476.1 unnamed protein product [Didymodactylos carnosus]